MDVFRIKGRLRRTGLSRKLKIFISSPGDVIPERQVARKVIGELNEEMFKLISNYENIWFQDILEGKIDYISQNMDYDSKILSEVLHYIDFICNQMIALFKQYFPELENM